eukprot:346831-Prorocentrum_minimum.AAC.2
MKTKLQYGPWKNMILPCYRSSTSLIVDTGSLHLGTTGHQHVEMTTCASKPNSQFAISRFALLRYPDPPLVDLADPPSFHGIGCVGSSYQGERAAIGRMASPMTPVTPDTVPHGYMFPTGGNRHWVKDRSSAQEHPPLPDFTARGLSNWFAGEFSTRFYAHHLTGLAAQVICRFSVHTFDTKFCLEDTRKSAEIHRDKLLKSPVDSSRFSLAKQQVNDDLVSFEKHLTSLFDDPETLEEYGNEAMQESLKGVVSFLLDVSREVRTCSPGP